MATGSSLLVTLLAAVVVASAGGGVAVDTVADSCNAIRDFVEVGFCEAALRSSPGAATADRHGHLLIAADLAAARGHSARDAAAAALARGRGEGGDDPGARDGLEACGILYGSSVPALRLMRGYAASRSWEAARSLLWLSGQAGMGCAAALDEPAAAAARMDRANEDFSLLTTMATALLNSVTSS
ncbi:hypothetical protein E2562_036424 [Oryza meyeriana var. granulata]|uniref:Pectinesterase inhibitor domain-containing protein n=1 Tax=Oryza meyeriana var. granulata TaxID=110450 RepID=A0A6G1BPU4_9ORYZ|nr:hypothetical protein E2562_036424 [Oryza meyeriana var. granulata]